MALNYRGGEVTGAMLGVSVYEDGSVRIAVWRKPRTNNYWATLTDEVHMTTEGLDRALAAVPALAGQLAALRLVVPENKGGHSGTCVEDVGAVLCWQRSEKLYLLQIPRPLAWLRKIVRHSDGT